MSRSPRSPVSRSITRRSSRLAAASACSECRAGTGRGVAQLADGDEQDRAGLERSEERCRRLGPRRGASRRGRRPRRRARETRSPSRLLASWSSPSSPRAGCRDSPPTASRASQAGAQQCGVFFFFFFIASSLILHI